jgi:hypothetical protein
VITCERVQINVESESVDVLHTLGSPTPAYLYWLTSVIGKPRAWINSTPAMDQIITNLTEIARLVPTQSISVDLINALYPDG